MRYFIFSDLHIGESDIDYAAVFCVFKNMREDDIAIVAGDWVEGWTRKYTDAIVQHSKLFQFMLKKVKIYVVGNHDSFAKWIARFKNDYIKVYYPYTLMEVDGKVWYIEHGHLCGKYGKLFKFLDRFDNTKIFNFLAREIEKLKIFSMSHKKIKIKDDMKDDAVNRGKKHNANVVIVGHDHLPTVEIRRGVWLVDPGTAIHDFTYIIYERGEFKLVRG